MWNLCRFTSNIRSICPNNFQWAFQQILISYQIHIWEFNGACVWVHSAVCAEIEMSSSCYFANYAVDIFNFTGTFFKCFAHSQLMIFFFTIPTNWFCSNFKSFEYHFFFNERLLRKFMHLPSWFIKKIVVVAKFLSEQDHFSLNST